MQSSKLNEARAKVRFHWPWWPWLIYSPLERQWEIQDYMSYIEKLENDLIKTKQEITEVRR